MSSEVYNIEDEASDIMLKNLTKIIADSDSKDVAFELLDETEKAGYSKVTKARHDGLSWKSLVRKLDMILSRGCKEL